MTNNLQQKNAQNYYNEINITIFCLRGFLLNSDV